MLFRRPNLGAPIRQPSEPALQSHLSVAPRAWESRTAGWLGRVDLGIGEAIPDVVIGVPTFGFRPQQLLIDLCGKAEVTIDRPAAEFQFRKGRLVLGGQRLRASWSSDRAVASATPSASGRPAVSPTPPWGRKGACAWGVWLGPRSTSFCRTTGGLRAGPWRWQSAEQTR